MGNKQNNRDYPIHPAVIERLTKPLALKLYKKLIEKKTELSNRPFTSKHALSHLGRERGGDQADQVNRLQEEAKHTGQMKRDLSLLEKILQALERMENGRYGICEQTDEVIELRRLESLPWTTLSIEGAEITESEDLLKHAR
ncbi:MAG: TraR/DksA family transcriptional regulator [Bdellovibrionaceae bacterium]|nr:TraR/DksA family transcriptional regulator [Pseudobdellovibrionaceae bacterium]